MHPAEPTPAPDPSLAPEPKAPTPGSPDRPRPPGALMTKADVAVYLGLSVKSIDRLIARSEFPPADFARPDVDRLGRKRVVRRWRPATLERWIDRNSERPGKGA